jgi:hypothetical protein
MIFGPAHLMRGGHRSCLPWSARKGREFLLANNVVYTLSVITALDGLNWRVTTRNCPWTICAAWLI